MKYLKVLNHVWKERQKSFPLNVGRKTRRACSWSRWTCWEVGKDREETPKNERRERSIPRSFISYKYFIFRSKGVRGGRWEGGGDRVLCVLLVLSSPIVKLRRFTLNMSKKAGRIGENNQKRLTTSTTCIEKKKNSHRRKEFYELLWGLSSLMSYERADEVLESW